MGLLSNCLMSALPYQHYEIRSFPPVRSKASPPRTNDLSLDGELRRPPKKNKTKKKRKKSMYPVCLAHVVRGMFYSVFATRRQPTYIYTQDFPSEVKFVQSKLRPVYPTMVRACAY